jgi:RNA polymerase sigma-70 factor (sigma-E family)
MTVILVFPQSCGGFWGGVTECGSGSTRSSRSVAFCCARRWPPQGESGTGAVGKPVNTVVDAQSATAVRGSPAADPVLAPSTAGLLDAPAGDLVAPDGNAPDAAVPEVTAVPEDTPVSEDIAGSEVTAVPEVNAVPEDTAGPEDTGGSEWGRADVRENSGKGVNLDAAGEPPGGGSRPTGVTATLSESAILPDIAPADEALAPDTSAISAFDAEEQRKPAVWAAADIVTEIYHGHYHALVRLAVLLVHDVQTAEEVVQDAFEAMHLASRRLRDSERALQYLRQTVVNRSRSVLRHRKVVDLHAPKPAPDEPSAEHAALAILERSAVAAALRALPERQREAIALRYYADFSEADIAKAMGISKGAVKSHTARAMASLKTKLTQETP